MIDFHVHTDASYCAENGLNAEFYAQQILQKNEPEYVCITDHSMAIYFPSDIAWKWEFINNRKIFDEWRQFGNERLSEHLKGLRKFSSCGILAGIETEMLHDGSLCFDQTFRKQLDIVIGSVHFISPPSESETLDFWLNHTLQLINCGIDIIGHPFRWLASKMEVGEETIKTVVKEAKANNVALELNSHYKYEREDILMLRRCAEAGALVSIASDAHRKEAFGDYSYHNLIIEKAGVKNCLLIKGASSVNIYDRFENFELKR